MKESWRLPCDRIHPVLDFYKKKKRLRLLEYIIWFSFLTDGSSICLTAKFVVLFFPQSEDGGAGPPDGEKSLNCKTTVVFLSLVRLLSCLPSENLDAAVLSKPTNMPKLQHVHSIIHDLN